MKFGQMLLRYRSKSNKGQWGSSIHIPYYFIVKVKTFISTNILHLIHANQSHETNDDLKPQSKKFLSSIPFNIHYLSFIIGIKFKMQYKIQYYSFVVCILLSVFISFEISYFYRMPNALIEIWAVYRLQSKFKMIKSIGESNVHISDSGLKLHFGFDPIK